MVVVHPGTVVPHYWHPVSPYYVSPFGTMNPPNTCGSGDTITVSGGGPVTGNWTTVEQAEAFGGSTPTFMLSPPKNYPCEIVPVVEYDRQH